MPQEQVPKYDEAAVKLSLQWAAETGPASYQNKLVGIQRDIASFQNEQLHPDDAYWNGSYEFGVDSHGHPALVTSEIAIPGRLHRNDSHAMVDSMAGNAVYVLDQIEKGNMPHDAWDTAREQLKQFRAVQEEALKLQDGESLLGFGMNGCKTSDGVALMQITRHNNIFSYETRLIGGLTEGAANEVLKKFVSDKATYLFLKEHTENPLFAVVKGHIDIDLKNQQRISKTVQDVLDARNEVKINTIGIAACRTKEAPKETDEKRFKKIDTSMVKRKQEYVLGFMKKKRMEEIPYVNIKSSDTRIYREPTKERVQNSVVLFDYAKQSKQAKQRVYLEETADKKIYETEYLKKHQEIREMIYPELSQEAVAHVHIQQTPQQQSEVVKIVEPAVKHAQVEMPIATFVMKSDNQVLPQYVEKALVITVPEIKQSYMEQNEPVMSEYQMPRWFQHSANIPERYKEIEIQQIEKNISKTEKLIEVDRIYIQDIHVLVDTLIKQIHQQEVEGSVKKLVWMESNDKSEFVPVEEVEIVQDATKTLHNLLHFLRKIVRAYAGDDVIRERVIGRIASDRQTDELEELEEYLTFLQSRQFRGGMFAVVN